MGVYDTFVDGKKNVQLKNFDNLLKVYRKGDAIQNYRNYPDDALFFCFAQPNDFVLIRNKKFMKIITYSEALDIIEKEKLKVFDCRDVEYKLEIVKIKKFPKKKGLRKKGEIRVI